MQWTRHCGPIPLELTIFYEDMGCQLSRAQKLHAMCNLVVLRDGITCITCITVLKLNIGCEAGMNHFTSPLNMKKNNTQRTFKGETGYLRHITFITYHIPMVTIHLEHDQVGMFLACRCIYIHCIFSGLVRGLQKAHLLTTWYLSTSECTIFHAQLVYVLTHDGSMGRMEYLPTYIYRKFMVN